MSKVEFTDDELDLIMTSLVTTIASYEKYIEQNGRHKLDVLTLKTFEDMKALYKKNKSKLY